jgi:carbonic anhydrase
MGTTDDLLRNAERYAEGYDGGAKAPPTKKVAVLACMDARLIPTRVLGLAEGEAHVIRNAGGVVSDDALRSLAISQQLMGTEEVVVLQHTDCGMQRLDDEQMVQKLCGPDGERPEFPMHTFTDLEENVRESIRAIRESPFVPNTDSVRGFVFDVETGRLTEVA